MQRSASSQPQKGEKALGKRKAAGDVDDVRVMNVAAADKRLTRAQAAEEQIDFAAAELFYGENLDN